MAADPDDAQVEALRSFNRFYTRHIGVLDEGLLNSPFTLAQARVLFELGMRERATATEISETVGIDLGYLSRILQEFSAKGLVLRKKCSSDGRRIWLSPSAKGRKAFQRLDRKSHALFRAMLAGMPPPSRTRLMASLRDVHATLSEPPRDDGNALVIRPHRIGDIGWAIARHAELYAKEYQFNEEFEALVATLFARFASRHDPAQERCWIAEWAGTRVGCVFVVHSESDPNVAQLRCLLVDPDGRGLGVGRRLVAECIAFARQAGYREMMLWTNAILVSACRIYREAGFSLEKEEVQHRFGQVLQAQYWRLVL